MCFLSDDLQHDVAFVYSIQVEVTKFIKVNLPHVANVEYFSDGCAAQYKNCSNFLNLCQHKTDFGLDASWSFFATSHGKSPCDGIGGTVKRETAHESLRRPLRDQICSVSDMISFCSSSLKSINFFNLPTEGIQLQRDNLSIRFQDATTIKGTRGFHFFKPIGHHSIGMKHTSTQTLFSYTYNFKDSLSHQIKL